MTRRAPVQGHADTGGRRPGCPRPVAARPRCPRGGTSRASKAPEDPSFFGNDCCFVATHRLGWGEVWIECACDVMALGPLTHQAHLSLIPDEALRLKRSELGHIDDARPDLGKDDCRSTGGEVGGRQTSLKRLYAAERAELGVESQARHAVDSDKRLASHAAGTQQLPRLLHRARNQSLGSTELREAATFHSVRE